MTWQDYIYFLSITSISWIVSLVLLSFKKLKGYRTIGVILLFVGLLSMLFFTIGLWISIERPVFRTKAETRLWYGIFTAAIGIVLYFRWKYLWLLLYTLAMGILFLFLNYLKPDTIDKALMPALQSPWFIPHVIVYLVGYAFLGVSFLIGVYGLYRMRKKQDIQSTGS